MFKVIWIIYAVNNLFGFLMMGIDKFKARHNNRRISEAALFLAAMFGGIGATLGMFCFHHKTRHWYFRIGFPLLAIIQVFLICRLRTII